jgi:glycogen operon protein
VRQQPGLRPWRWLDGRAAGRWGEKDVSWFRPDGAEFERKDWDLAAPRALCVHVVGHLADTTAAEEPRPRGYLLLFNAAPNCVTFVVPFAVTGPWQAMFDTARRECEADLRAPGEAITLLAYSSQLYVSQS